MQGIKQWKLSQSLRVQGCIYSIFYLWHGKKKYILTCDMDSPLVSLGQPLNSSVPHLDSKRQVLPRWYFSLRGLLSLVQNISKLE